MALIFSHWRGCQTSRQCWPNQWSHHHMKCVDNFALIQPLYSTPKPTILYIGAIWGLTCSTRAECAHLSRVGWQNKCSPQQWGQRGVSQFPSMIHVKLSLPHSSLRWYFIRIMHIWTFSNSVSIVERSQISSTEFHFISTMSSVIASILINLLNRFRANSFLVDM